MVLAGCGCSLFLVDLRDHAQAAIAQHGFPATWQDSPSLRRAENVALCGNVEHHRIAGHYWSLMFV